MAIVDVNFHSNCLNRMVTYKAIIPTEHKLKNKPFKTLYLLHGITDNHNQWIVGTRIVLLANRYRLAVIMPAGENSFYVDDEARGHLYGEFIGCELVEHTRQLFHLSEKREDTFIAGLSMGGYGAIRNGLKYHQTFSHIAGLSSALILDRALHSTPDDEWILGRRPYYESIFGNLDELLGSDKDYKALVKHLKHEQVNLPKLYLACGTEDFLLEANRDFHDFLKQEDIDFTYTEGPGRHDWVFWDTYIEKVIEWLPLSTEASI